MTREDVITAMSCFRDDLHLNEDEEAILFDFAISDMKRVEQLEAENKRLKEGVATIKAEIEKQEKWLSQVGVTVCNVDVAFNVIKFVAESEG